MEGGDEDEQMRDAASDDDDDDEEEQQQLQEPAPWYEIILAGVRANNWDSVRELISHHEHDLIDGFIDYMLWTAAREGHVEACRLLFNSLSDGWKEKYLQEESEDDDSPLHIAIGMLRFDAVRFFLQECNFNVNQVNGEGITALVKSIATSQNSVGMTRLLLENGANPNQIGVREGHYVFPLFLAIDFDKTEEIRLLLEHGADPNLNEHVDDDVLAFNVEYAISKGNAEIVRLLLQYGALLDPRARCWAVYRAVKDEKVEVCRVLLQHGIMDPFFVYQEGRYDDPTTCLFHVVAGGENTDVLELFFEHWDERFAWNGGKNDADDYPIHVICRYSNVSLQAVKFVVERQPHVLATVDSEQGFSPLHIAAAVDANLDVIYCLLRHYPDALTRLPRARSTVE